MSKCCICDSNIGLFSGFKISDGNYVCSKCMSKTTKYMKNSLKILSLPQLSSYFHYIDEHSKEFSDAFHESANYGRLHIDKDNGLFCICEKSNIDKNGKLKIAIPDIFPSLLIEDVSIDFIKEKSQNPSSKIKGKLVFNASLNNPRMLISTVIKDHVLYEYNRINDEQVSLIEPYELNFFKTLFEEMCNYQIKQYNDSIKIEAEIRRIQEEEKKKQQEKQHYEEERKRKEEPSVNTTLASALNLFMFDNGNYTEAELKAQRNRLLKTFHPDDGNVDTSQYASKINKAYELLKENLKK